MYARFPLAPPQKQLASAGAELRRKPIASRLLKGPATVSKFASRLCAWYRESATPAETFAAFGRLPPAPWPGRVARNSFQPSIPGTVHKPGGCRLRSVPSRRTPFPVPATTYFRPTKRRGGRTGSLPQLSAAGWSSRPSDEDDLIHAEQPSSARYWKVPRVTTQGSRPWDERNRSRWELVRCPTCKFQHTGPSGSPPRLSAGAYSTPRARAARHFLAAFGSARTVFLLSVAQSLQ